MLLPEACFPLRPGSQGLSGPLTCWGTKFVKCLPLQIWSVCVCVCVCVMGRSAVGNRAAEPAGGSPPGCECHPHSRRLPVGYSCLAFSGNAGLHTQGHHQPRPWRSEWIHKILLLLKELVMEMGGWGTWSGGRNPPFVGWQTSLSFYSMCVCSVAQSCLTLCNPMEPAGLLCPWNSPGKNTGVGYHSLLQGIFLTPGPNPVSCIAGRFFTIGASREATFYLMLRH